MREAIEDLLPDTCNLLAVSESADGQGGFSQTWGTASSSVACRLDVVTGREQMAGGALQPFIRTMLSLPYNTTITDAYRVEHGGITYAVIAPPNTDQSWIAVKRVELERV
jgi:head-tail adaptor